MNKLFFIALFIFGFLSVKAQNLNDVYSSYETSLASKDYETAYKAIARCDDETGHSPFTSLAKAIMLECGLGVQKNDFEAMIAFLNCQNYEYLKQKMRDIAKNVREMGIEIDVAAHDKLQDTFEQNADTYFKLSDTDQRKIQAFACRMSAVRNYRHAISSRNENELDDMLADAASCEEFALKADSLNGDVYSHYLLGILYYEGVLGYKEKAKGMKYLNSAVEEGCKSAMLYLADIKLSQGLRLEADELKKKAESIEMIPLQPIIKNDLEWLNNPNIEL